MIVGFNTDIKYKNETFHVQTEDKGKKNPTVETLVYHRGEILLSRRVSYAHLMEKADLTDRIKAMMTNSHDQVISDLKGGKFIHLLSLDTPAIEDKSLDDMVIDYFNKEAS
ncbi:MAG: hypothetical protein KAT34_11970 [Candidatus Aminicenantes bacterium]|nr:hypothetical protein [Candidatus Aminicenantes bacterium]